MVMTMNTGNKYQMEYDTTRIYELVYITTILFADFSGKTTDRIYDKPHILYCYDVWIGESALW